MGTEGVAQDVHTTWHPSLPRRPLDKILDHLLCQRLTHPPDQHTRPSQMPVLLQCTSKPSGKPDVTLSPTFAGRHAPLPVRPLDRQLSGWPIHVAPLERHHFATPEARVHPDLPALRLYKPAGRGYAVWATYPTD